MLGRTPLLLLLFSLLLLLLFLFKSIWTDTFPLCIDISLTSALTLGYMWNNTNITSTGPSGGSQDRQGQNVWATSSIRGCRAAAPHENVCEAPLALPHQFTSFRKSLFFVVSCVVLGIRLGHQATVTTSLPSGSLCSSQCSQCSSQGHVINQRHTVHCTR